MNLDQDDIDKLVNAMKLDTERVTGAHRVRMLRLTMMTLVIVTIAGTGHYFHIEAIAKIGEVTVSCLYSFVMEMAQGGKSFGPLERLGGVFKRNR